MGIERAWRGRKSWLLPAMHRYFRVELQGAVEAIPDWSRSPTIFIMNHTALVGLEVYLLYAALERLRPGAARIRTTVWAPFLKLPVLGGFYSANGCLAMDVAAVSSALRAGESVLVFPEGPDATDVRDKVASFHAGFLRIVRELADEIDVPVVPMGWSGVDEANPWFVTTNRSLVKILMKPLMPSFDFALVPRPPLLRPSKVVFVAGDPLRFTAEQLGSEEALRAQLGRVRDIVIGLVEEAERLRDKRIEQSLVERALHAAFRMRRVRWKRRSNASASSEA